MLDGRNNECSQSLWMWHLGIWFRGGCGGAGLLLDLEILEGFSKLNSSVIPHWLPQLPWLLSHVCSDQDGCKSHLGSGWECQCSHPGTKELGALSPIPKSCI